MLSFNFGISFPFPDNIYTSQKLSSLLKNKEKNPPSPPKKKIQIKNYHFYYAHAVKVDFIKKCRLAWRCVEKWMHKKEYYPHSNCPQFDMCRKLRSAKFTILFLPAISANFPILVGGGHEKSLLWKETNSTQTLILPTHRLSSLSKR